MDRFQGSDPEAASKMAGLMFAYAAQLETKIQEMTRTLPECAWSGSDAQLFRTDWDGLLSVNLIAAVEELRKHARTLSDRGDRQGQISLR